MKYFKISLLMSTALTTLATIAMEQNTPYHKPLPPLPPARTSSLPGWTAATPAVSTTDSNGMTWQTAITETASEAEPAIPPRPSNWKQPAKPARPTPMRMQSAPVIEESNEFTTPIIAQTFDGPRPDVTPPAPVLQTHYPPTTYVNPSYLPIHTPHALVTQPTVVLTKDQEASIQKINIALHELLEYLIKITKHGAKLGLAAATEENTALIFESVKEGIQITKNIALATKAIADIYIQSDKLSQASPEVREVARGRVQEIMHSERFMTTVTKFQEFAKNPFIPTPLRSPLNSLAEKVKNLPISISNRIVKK